MIQVFFKNIERSELAREAVNERLQRVLDRFPDLKEGTITVTIDMQNSPDHAGPDLFTVTLNIASGRYRGVRLSKSSDSFYRALADLIEHSLERLNRFGDRTRVKNRNQSRALEPTAEANMG